MEEKEEKKRKRASRTSSNRRDLCSTRSFLVHVIHDLALPHAVLQHRLAFVLSFVRMFLIAQHYLSEPFLVSIFALFISSSSECFAVSRLRLCASVVLILVKSVAIETSFISAAIGTSGLECVLVAAFAQPRMFGVCLMLLFISSSEFFTVCTLFFLSATCFS